MSGILYKVDANGKRISENIKAVFENHLGRLYFCAASFGMINLNKGDYFFYSDDDIDINKKYQVDRVISDSKIEAKL